MRARSRMRQEAEAMENMEDMLYEVFRHLDAKSLGSAACVSTRWKRTAEEEALWEDICSAHWRGHGPRQLSSVVRALGGFRRFYVHCLRPLLRRQVDLKRWSKEHVHLSLSLFSIDCYERLGRFRSNNPSTSLKFLSTPTSPQPHFTCFPLHKKSLHPPPSSSSLAFQGH